MNNNSVMYLTTSAPSPYASCDSPIASARKPKTSIKKSEAQSPKPNPKKLSSKLYDATGIGKNGNIMNTVRNALFAPVGGRGGDDAAEIESSSAPSSVKCGTPNMTTSTSPTRSTSSLPSINQNVVPNGGNAGSANNSFRTANTVQAPNSPAAVTVSTSGRPPASPTPKAMGTVNSPNARPAPIVQIAADDDGDDEDVFNPYQFMYALPPHAYVKIPNKLVLPSMQQPKRAITLVLDLDETLVHCSVEPIEKPDAVFPVLFNGVNYQVYVRKRPFLEFFLEAIAPLYEVVLFTASQKVYADKLCEYIDPDRKYIRHKLFRDSCLCVQGNYVKDIDVLGRNLAQTVLVDNSPYAYAYQIDNGIPIESWYDQDDDQELLKLLSFLKNKIDNSADVRPVIRDYFKTHKLLEDARRGVPMRHMKIETL